MMDDSAAAARVLDRLRAHGVSVWIDDPGPATPLLRTCSGCPSDHSRSHATS